MNRYELTYIIDTALEETARKELIEKVSALIAANGGEVETVNEEPWGKGAKRLAYPINYKTEGWYVLGTFKAPADLPRELERNLEIYDSVLRYLIVKLEVKKSSVKPRAARPVAAPAVEAPVASPFAITSKTITVYTGVSIYYNDEYFQPTDYYIRRNSK